MADSRPGTGEQAQDAKMWGGVHKMMGHVNVIQDLVWEALVADTETI